VEKSTLIKKNFNYLLDNFACQNSFGDKVLQVLDGLIANDPKQQTRFEYSLQIENGRFNRAIRFVNYDTYYLRTEKEKYLKRINLIEKIVFFVSRPSIILGTFFNIIRKLSFNYLPLYLGLELHNNKYIFLKLYLNCFSQYKSDNILIEQLIKNIFDKLGLHFKIKNREIPLIGLTLNENGDILSHKIYYLYDKYSDLKFLDFTSRELRIFHWANHYNRLNYFDVMERYNRRKVVSRKIEVHPGNYKNFLSSLCEVTGNKAVFLKIDEIIKVTNGEIEAVGIEKEKLTIYVTMRNYGRRKILL